MKLVTIIGARPQFIKAAAVSRAIAAHNQKVSKDSGVISEYIVHTGQHYDRNMSDVFFRELQIPEPNLNLGIGSGTHGLQTGEMIIQIEKVLIDQKPNWVLVYGDTNSTLAGALAAVKLHIPVAHVEAGLRSFNKKMPEEHNRVLTDHCSDLLFCPTQTAVDNLKKEGLHGGVHWVGDVMYDSVLFNANLAEEQSEIITKLSLKNIEFALATVHRAENTDDSVNLESIFKALEFISKEHMPVIVPLHPRTRKIIHSSQISINSVRIIDPVSYLDMLNLEKHSKLILTDSGGVQKEAYWLRVPCITLRSETEWVETVENGWNIIAGTNADRIITSFLGPKGLEDQSLKFGDGHAADKLISIIAEDI